MKWEGNFTQIPNEVIWSMNLSLAAKMIFLILASCKEPAHPDYDDIIEVTRFSPKRVIAAIRELIDHKIISYQPGGLNRNGLERTANVYFLNSNRSEWVVSLPLRKLEDDGPASATEVTQLPLRKSIKTKDYLPKRVRVVSLTTKQTTNAPSPASGGDTRPLPVFDLDKLASTDPTFKHDTLAFLNQVHEALERKEYIDLIPSLVGAYSASCGPCGLTLDQLFKLLDPVVRPHFYGDRGEKLFAKLHGSVRSAYQAGQLKYQLAKETPAEKEKRIQQEKEAFLQSLHADGAI